MQTLRNYQEHTATAIVQAREAGLNRLLVQAATGTGKTSTFSSLPARLAPWLETFPVHSRRMLVIAHREELIAQAVTRLRSFNPGVMVDIEQAGLYSSRYSEIVVASIQTLTAGKCRRLKRLIAREPFRLVIYDECFPAGTLVDGRPIETIHVGDTVTALDTTTGAIVAGRVVRTMCHQRRVPLVSIRVGAKHLVCTTNHKIWTQRGWVAAINLCVGSDMMASTTENHHGHSFRRDGSVLSLQSPENARYTATGENLQGVKASILLGQLSGCDTRARIIGADGEDEPQIRFRENDGAQSDALASGTGEDAHDVARNAMEAANPGRKRATAPASPIGASGRSGMADRSGCENRVCAGREQLSDVLQAGYRQSSIEDRDRSERRVALLETGLGREEGCVLAWERVDGIEIHEQDGNDRTARRSADRLVYNLEVEHVHTYTANGFIVSNCHHASSPSARTALVHLGFLPPADASDKESLDAPSYEDVQTMASALAGWDAIAPKDRLLVGFTATPNRSDGVGLGCIFQSIVDTYPIRQAIDDGWLVPIVPWVVETATDLDTVRINHGDFNQKDLAGAVNTPQRNQLAVAGWHEHALNRPTIAFTVDVAHAYALADAFSASGIKAAAVSGETPKEERAATLAAFTRGDVLVLCNCQVFTEGTDLPLASCILMAKPTKSATLYTQCVGRGLRTYPGKEDCVILDVVDVARRHSLQQAPVLYGLPPNLNAKGKTLRSVAEDLEAFLVKYPGFNVEGAGRLSLAELQAKATQIDIWMVPTVGAFGAGRTLNWIKIAQDSYRVQYPWADGTEALTVTKDMLGHYDVSLTLRTPLGPARQRTIAAQVESAEAAAGLAEAFVKAERQSVTKLVDKDAPWRKKPANDKQLGLMRILNIPIKRGITAGEASTQIDIAKAKRGR